MKTQKIPIAQLVPGEKTVEAEEVENARVLIESGKAMPPRVIHIDAYYYVADGNHRVMAAKQLGHETIECDVRPWKRKPNVADFDEDRCKEAVELGYLGFAKVRIASKEEKMKEYEEEEDDL